MGSKRSYLLTGLDQLLRLVLEGRSDCLKSYKDFVLCQKALGGGRALTNKVVKKKRKNFKSRFLIMAPLSPLTRAMTLDNPVNPPVIWFAHL